MATVITEFFQSIVVDVGGVVCRGLQSAKCPTLRLQLIGRMQPVFNLTSKRERIRDWVENRKESRTVATEVTVGVLATFSHWAIHRIRLRELFSA